MQPYVYYDNDNEINVEWINKDMRFGIGYDPSEKKWFWWCATDSGSDHGWLPEELVNAIIDNYRRDKYDDNNPYWSPVFGSH